MSIGIKMQSLNNIKDVYHTMFDLIKQWERVPELRLGQLLMNFISWYGDLSYLSNQDFVLNLKYYIDKVKGER